MSKKFRIHDSYFPCYAPISLGAILLLGTCHSALAAVSHSGITQISSKQQPGALVHNASRSKGGPSGRPAGANHRSPKTLTSSTVEAVTSTGSRAQGTLSRPASVNVLTGREIQDLHIVQPKDIGPYVPGVVAVNANSGTMPYFTIRGVGLDDFVGTNMAGVGFYADGVFEPFPTLYNAAMFDMSNITVEKGPQGFDFGRSTTGGSISIETNKPTEKFGGYLDWGYSSYGTNMATAAFNTPITPKILNRFSFSYVNGGAWQHDINTKERYGKQDMLSLRNLTKFVIDDSSSLLLNIHMTRDRSLSVSPQDLDGDALNGTLTGTIGVGQNAKYNAVNVGNERPTRDEIGGGVNVSYSKDFTFGSFVSTTALDLYHRNDFDNYDGQSVHTGDYKWNDTYIVQSHDMHIATTLFNRTRLKAGIFQSYDKIDGRYTWYQGNIFGVQNANFTSKFIQQNISAGLYLDTETKITRRLMFIAAGRLSYDDRSFNGGTTDDNGVISGLPGAYLAQTNRSHPYERLTGRIGLKYTLFGNSHIYGTISNGYKPGTYFAKPVKTQGGLDYVRPENLIAYEVGAKFSFFKDKINLSGALFDYEYHNRQTMFTVLDTTGIYTLALGSVRRARTRGGEVAATINNLAPNLSLHSSFAYLDAQTLTSTATVGGLSVDGSAPAHSTLPMAPRFSWQAVARYKVPLPIDYQLTFQASYAWKDNMVSLGGDPNGKQSKISMMGLRLEFAPKSEKWTAAVYVDNLQNNHGSTYSFSAADGSHVSYVQTPRWVGCDLRYNF